MTAPSIYVACRVCELPNPNAGCERLRCARCSDDVWVDPLHYVPVKALQGSLRVCCVQCAAELEEKR